MKISFGSIPAYKESVWAAQAMANQPPKYTGVPNPIEIRVKPDEKHKLAHIKLSLTKKADFSAANCIVLSIEANPKILAGPKNAVIDSRVLELAREFVILNQTLLLRYYEGRITDTKKVLESLKHLKTKKTRLEMEKEAEKKKAQKV